MFTSDVALLGLLAKLPPAARRTLMVLATICVALAVVASVDAQWIEHTVGLSPDGGSGSAEWELVIAFAAAGLLLGAVASVAGLARTRLARGGKPVVSRG